MLLWKLWLLGIAASIEYASLLVISGTTTSGLLLWIFRSVVVDMS